VVEWFDREDWKVKDHIIMATNDPILHAVADENGVMSFNTHEGIRKIGAFYALRDVAGEIKGNSWVLLQPTSPFRTADDLQEWWDIAEKEGCYYTGGLHTPCGCFYKFTRRFLAEEEWTGEEGQPFLPGHKCHDIDTKEDLEEAREMYKG